MSSRKGFRNRVRQLKDQYIKSSGGLGGTAAGFRELCRKDRYDNPGLYDPYMDEAVDSVAREIWESDPKPEPDNPDLWKFSGNPLPEYLTFPDPGNRAEFRKIEINSAKLAHYREHAIIRMRKGAETTAVGAEMMNIYDEMLEKAGGDSGALIRDIKD